MSDPKSILAALKAQLEAASALSYVKEFLYEERENVTLLPTVMIEIDTDEESDQADVNDYVRLTLKCRLVCAVKSVDKDKLIVGNENVTGLTKIRNDIGKAISADPTLGGVANWTRITGTNYNHFTAYPQRRIAVYIEIEFEQYGLTRA